MSPATRQVKRVAEKNNCLSCSWGHQKGSEREEQSAACPALIFYERRAASPTYTVTFFLF